MTMDELGRLFIACGVVGMVCWKAGLRVGWSEGLRKGHADGERRLRQYQADQAMNTRRHGVRVNLDRRRFMDGGH